MLARPRWLALAHPLLFALLPSISLLAHNINDAPPFHALRPTVLSALAAASLLWALRRLVRDLHAAGLITSITLVLFFSYGHVYLGLLGPDTQGLFRWLGLVGQPVAVAVVWLVVFSGAVFVILRTRHARRVLSQAFVLMAVVATAVPLGQIGVHEYQLSQPLPVPSANLPMVDSSGEDARPDIYLFVLDGYGREDVLQELFAIDNSPFLDELRSMGFQVADRSRSNYTQTSLSVASMLNMDYVQTLLGDSLPANGDRTALARLIRWSSVIEAFEGLGYTIVGLPSGYRLTELDHADVFPREPLGGATTLERLAYETSALIMLQEVASSLGRQPVYPGYRAHRERIEYVLDRLIETPGIPGPKFVFVHLLVPHPPFVFDGRGGAVSQRYPFTLLDGDAFPGTSEEYIQGYAAQLEYTNQRMLQVLRGILVGSTRPPIIVIHGDHGSGLGLDWHSAQDSDLRERSSNLSAYYLPGAPEGLVHPGITPVNSFRLVLNQYFGADLEQLPDQSYYSTWEHPYRFVPIEG